jgi:hypothetical protein
MACPLYIDFTRMCLQKFPELVKFTVFRTCESELYTDCPVYLVHGSGFCCKYFHSCTIQHVENMSKVIMEIFMSKVTFDVLKGLWMNYCLSSKNSKTCAKYQLYSKGEEPPLELQPDGSIMNPSDFINKRKLISHPPE